MGRSVHGPWRSPDVLGGHCSGTTHTPSIAFQHLPPNSAGNGHATEVRGHPALSPHSCAPTLSAPSESLGSKQAVEAA